MSTYLPYEATVVRTEDLHRAAQSRRVAVVETPVRRVERPVAIRRATERDTHALERLAQLDSSRPLTGDVLVAEVADEMVAAVSIDTGDVVADPFRPTAHLVEDLQVRVQRLEAGRALKPRLRFLFRARTA